MDNKPENKAGKVYLVGAGPGDPGLMTVKALELLKKADSVVYDRLVDINIGDYVESGTELIFAGKAPDRHTLKQTEINQLLGSLAMQGKTVVRLKGGDPFVLGRGGEEAEHLKSLGIKFEVVPGVTSAVAAPAYAGIPVTHRGLASSFAVITGHEDPDKEISSINWGKLATGADTLVFLMAMARMGQITKRLMENGLAGDTPAAVIKDGTRPSQKVICATLETISEAVRKFEVGPPAVLIVGRVAGLRNSLEWFDNRPLFSKKILVTRSRHQASRLSRVLFEAGAIPVEQPAIEIEPFKNTERLDKAIKSIQKYQWVVFTSVNGVSIFFKRLSELGYDSRKLNDLRVGAIGPATASLLLEHGISPDYMPQEYTGSAFIKNLDKNMVKGQFFLLPRAKAADDEVPMGIESLGGQVDDVPIYDTVPSRKTLQKIKLMLEQKQIDVATFASSSTVTNLLGALGSQAQDLLEGVDIACIGPKTTATAQKAGLSVKIIARESTIPGLVRAMEEYYDRRSSYGS